MKGVTFASIGAAPAVVDTLEKPTPGPEQLLVRCHWLAINPVDAAMSAMGFFVIDWPLVLGVDGSGVVTEVGKDAAIKYGFKVGDNVFGCTRIGSPGYNSGQEYYLMDAQIAMRKPENISLAEAATLGVASETACFGIFEGLQVPLPDPSNLPPSRNEWIIILGGASSVGKAAIQIAKAAGYMVIASCANNSAKTVKEFGADATFDYKTSVEQQVKDVTAITGKDVSRIFDAAASDDPVLANALFRTSGASSKLFSTANDWSGIQDFGGGKSYLVHIAHVGRPESAILNAKYERYNRLITQLIEARHLRPLDSKVVGQGGFEDAIRAFDLHRSGGAGSKKVVVRIHGD